MTDADDIDGGRDDKGEGWERHNATASLLQHGLSETLIGAFEALAEQTELDGRPRFSERTVRELRRIVLCRSYANACLELGWWLWTLWRGGGADAPLRAVYMDHITNSRRALDAVARGTLRLPAEASVDGAQCSVSAGGEAFVLHLGRLPLWTALLELLVFIDPAVLRPTDTDEAPGAVANRLQRALYGFLAEHAQPSGAPAVRGEEACVVVVEDQRPGGSQRKGRDLPQGPLRKARGPGEGGAGGVVLHGARRDF